MTSSGAASCVAAVPRLVVVRLASDNLGQPGRLAPSAWLIIGRRAEYQTVSPYTAAAVAAPERQRSIGNAASALSPDIT